MYCRFCGVFVGLGNAHECPKERALKLSYLPPEQLRWWTAGACGIVAAVVLTLVLTTVRAVDLTSLYSQLAALRGVPDDDGVYRLIQLARRTDNLGYALILVSLGAVGAFAFWRRTTLQMVERFGTAGKEALAHWTYLALLISNLAAGGLTLFLRHQPVHRTPLPVALLDLETNLQNAMIVDIGWCVPAVLLAAAVAVIVRKVWALAQPKPEPATQPAL